eukprot:TRINITY_DN766_c0_g1_i11.p1 TRINITY_DN766_c0_g1~~TRINITY_DN766_c0_g1_i11.p1  ORF type:complete len:202 (+),score=17.05 TRINITY_DN766_c0_g1_i11:145-750(+)
MAWYTKRLHSAARNGEIEEVRRLTQQANAALNEPDASGCTPLHYAVLADSPVEICEILISQGAQVDAQNNGGETPLHIACYFGNAPCAAVLLKYGAQRGGINKYGKTPMDFARDLGNTNCLDLITRWHALRPLHAFCLLKCAQLQVQPETSQLPQHLQAEIRKIKESPAVEWPGLLDDLTLARKGGSTTPPPGTRKRSRLH